MVEHVAGRRACNDRGPSRPHDSGLPMSTARSSGSQLEPAPGPGSVEGAAPPFRMLRDSLPILSATVVPLLILLAGWRDRVGPMLSLRAAEVFCIARIGLTGYFVSRYLRRPVSGATWLTCLVMATVGLLVVATKALLGHG